MEEVSAVADLVRIHLAHKPQVNHPGFNTAVHFRLCHPGEIQVPVDDGEDGTGWSTYHPHWLLFTKEPQRPSSFFGTGEIPCLPVRPQGPQVHNFKSNNIKRGHPARGSLESALPINLE